MTPQELKNSILQLAIQGKLVKQRPEERTAEELYQQIQFEKRRLIKDGKIKKEKHLLEIAEDEKPFDIPNTWKWVRLGDCTSYAERKEKISASNITDDMWSLDLEDIEKETSRIINRCCASKRKIVGDKVQFYRGQILYSKLRPYLKKILVAPDDGICSSEMVPFIAYGNIDSQYLVYVLKAPHVDYVINSVTYGVKMPRVGTETMVNLLIPLPPLAEQKRIVAKIEDLLPYIDRYKQAWSKLEDFNKRFPGYMQKSILQTAIQGKLVEQRPEEGTGEELYQQIQAEKHRLIKTGAIKKEKALPEITEDEKPFDIPDSWKWVSVGDTCTNIQYGTSQKSSQTGKVAVLRMGNIQNGKLNYDSLVYSSYESDIEKYSLNSNDLLFNRTNSKELVGKTAIYKGDIPAIYAGYLVRITPVLLDSDYLNYVMQSQFYWIYCQNVRSDAIGQSNINAEKLKRFFFPLPPLTEQKRIVAKLEELLPLCEKLK
jgi:type I restriction enzyme S subunit